MIVRIWFNTDYNLKSEGELQETKHEPRILTSAVPVRVTLGPLGTIAPVQTRSLRGRSLPGAVDVAEA